MRLQFHQAEENATPEAILSESNLIKDIKFMCRGNKASSYVHGIIHLNFQMLYTFSTFCDVYREPDPKKLHQYEFIKKWSEDSASIEIDDTPFLFTVPATARSEQQ